MSNKPPFTAEYISNGADARLQPEAKELAEQVFLMRAKLEELRGEMKDAPIITEYDNGGQQRGTHINPIFKAHKDLLLTYTKTISALAAIIGENDPGELDNTLKTMRNRYNISPICPQIKKEDNEPGAAAAEATGTDDISKSYWKKGKRRKHEPQ